MGATERYVTIPVSVVAGVCHNRLVSICSKFIVCIPNNWRTATGNWMTRMRSPAPCQTWEALEFIRNLRQEAFHTAVKRKQTETSLKLWFCQLSLSFYSLVLQGLQIIPESHLASIGKVVSFHDGVLRDSWCLAGHSYSLKSQGRSILLDWIKQKQHDRKTTTHLQSSVFYHGKKLPYGQLWNQFG